MYLFLLPLLLLAQNTFSHQPPKKELKIYRKSMKNTEKWFRIFEGVSLAGSAACAMFIRHAIKNHRSDPGLTAFAVCYLLFPSCFAALFHRAANNCKKWNKRLGRPILIFDDEGFTCEVLGKDYVKNIRYLWKNVVSHWATGVVDEYGNQISKQWNYHVKGVDNIVTIQAHNLEIPKHLSAVVESLRQGHVQALYLQ